MPADELAMLYNRQCEELAASHPDWDEIEILENAVGAFATVEG